MNSKNSPSALFGVHNRRHSLVNSPGWFQRFKFFNNFNSWTTSKSFSDIWHVKHDIWYFFSIVSVDCLRSKPMLKKFSQGDHFCHHGKGKYLNVDYHDHWSYFVSLSWCFFLFISDLWFPGWWFLLNFVYNYHFKALCHLHWNFDVMF